jgi:NAD(P)-dependent dehydrogenase (short-subunit alcohol dehydrogenase family)
MATLEAGPVVLVTGATGVLGRAVVARFAADGVQLGLAGRDTGRLEALAADLGLGTDRWTPAVGDLRDPEAAAAVARTVEARFGRVDVVVHLVGGWTGGTPVVDLDPAELRSMLDQHLWTTLHLVRAVVPGMVERGFGRVLAVTSPLASNPGPRGASYAIAKAAEEVLLRSLSREVSGSGVTANLVAVRTIDTAHERETSPTTRNAAWATPEEIAGVLAFLASPAAAAITGARIPLDGRA